MSSTSKQAEIVRSERMDFEMVALQTRQAVPTAAKMIIGGLIGGAVMDAFAAGALAPVLIIGFASLIAGMFVHSAASR
jgi:predicted lipid-binding transport protein (Tim44 family)